MVGEGPHHSWHLRFMSVSGDCGAGIGDSPSLAESVTEDAPCVETDWVEAA